MFSYASTGDLNKSTYCIAALLDNQPVILQEGEETIALETSNHDSVNTNRGVASPWVRSLFLRGEDLQCEFIRLLQLQIHSKLSNHFSLMKENHKLLMCLPSALSVHFLKKWTSTYQSNTSLIAKKVGSSSPVSTLFSLLSLYLLHRFGKNSTSSTWHNLGKVNSLKQWGKSDEERVFLAYEDIHLTGEIHSRLCEVKLRFEGKSLSLVLLRQHRIPGHLRVQNLIPHLPEKEEHYTLIWQAIHSKNESPGDALSSHLGEYPLCRPCWLSAGPQNRAVGALAWPVLRELCTFNDIRVRWNPQYAFLPAPCHGDMIPQPLTFQSETDFNWSTVWHKAQKQTQGTRQRFYPLGYRLFWQATCGDVWSHLDDILLNIEEIESLEGCGMSVVQYMQYFSCTLGHTNKFFLEHETESNIPATRSSLRWERSTHRLYPNLNPWQFS